MTRCVNCMVKITRTEAIKEMGDRCPVCLAPWGKRTGQAPPKASKTAMPGRRGPSKAERDADKAVEVHPSMTLDDEYRQSVPGHPLGPGMPTGAGFRLDGESHRDAWKRILRFDPCAYCGEPAEILPATDGETVVGSNTIDHIKPQATKDRKGIHDWTNYTASCARCNVRKADRPLHWFLYIRRISAPRKVEAEAA